MIAFYSHHKLYIVYNAYTEPIEMMSPETMLYAYSYVSFKRNE